MTVSERRKLPLSTPTDYRTESQGAWRNWLAHLPYKEGVTGSSPVVPTVFLENLCFSGVFAFQAHRFSGSLFRSRSAEWLVARSKVVLPRDSLGFADPRADDANRVDQGCKFKNSSSPGHLARHFTMRNSPSQAMVAPVRSCNESALPASDNPQNPKKRPLALASPRLRKQNISFATCVIGVLAMLERTVQAVRHNEAELRTLIAESSAAGDYDAV